VPSERADPWVGFGCGETLRVVIVLGNEPLCSLGTLDRYTSKGADEQSSRRAPGSLADPGVCFLQFTLDLIRGWCSPTQQGIRR